MMDRKTIVVVVCCLLALFASQKIINTLYPPKPKAPQSLTAASSNAAPQQALISKPAEPSIATTQVANTESALPHVAEEIVSLSNDLIRVDFTSWGGGVRSVELFKHKAFDTGLATLNGSGLVPALSLVGVSG